MTMKKYIALVQYNEEYEFAAECESPQAFIDYFIKRDPADLKIEDHGMTDKPLIERIYIYETDEDGDIDCDKGAVAEWKWDDRDEDN